MFDSWGSIVPLANDSFMYLFCMDKWWRILRFDQAFALQYDEGRLFEEDSTGEKAPF